MAESRLKYLVLYEILKNESSAEKPLTTTEICRKLAERNIAKNKRNLPRDIEGLAMLGYRVEKVRMGHENAFYIPANKDLSEGEMKIILDALQATRFLTAEKTEIISQKLLAQFGGDEISQNALDNKVIFNVNKAESDAAYDNVAIITKAINNNHQITFKVFDYDENFEKTYRYNGEIRTEEPITMVFNDDNYYLITKNNDANKTGDMIHFRIDHIDNVTEIAAPITAEAVALRETVGTSLEHVIAMFNGPLTDVAIKVTDLKLLKYFFEKFGRASTKAIKIAPDNYIVSVKVNVSAPFYGFLFTLGSGVEILGPESVKGKYEEMNKKTNEQ